jgi:integrase
MPRVPITELPELVRAIASYDGENNLRRREITRDALMFTLLTWARTGETRFATWHEFEGLDSPQPLWRIAPHMAPGPRISDRSAPAIVAIIPS